jgi:hypothetical protein
MANPNLVQVEIRCDCGERRSWCVRIDRNVPEPLRCAGGRRRRNGPRHQVPEVRPPLLRHPPDSGASGQRGHAWGWAATSEKGSSFSSADSQMAWEH